MNEDQQFEIVDRLKSLWPNSSFDVDTMRGYGAVCEPHTIESGNAAVDAMLADAPKFISPAEFSRYLNLSKNKIEIETKRAGVAEVKSRPYLCKFCKNTGLVGLVPKNDPMATATSFACTECDAAEKKGYRKSTCYPSFSRDLLATWNFYSLDDLLKTSAESLAKRMLAKPAKAKLRNDSGSR